MVSAPPSAADGGATLLQLEDASEKNAIGITLDGSTGAATFRVRAAGGDANGKALVTFTAYASVCRSARVSWLIRPSRG